MKKNKLSNSEEMVMSIFWKEARPLTSLEIFEISRISADASAWSMNYIHKMLITLQDKNLLEICGVAKEGKKYVRQFLPCISREEYIADMLDRQGINSAALAKIAMALVKRQAKKEAEEENNQLIADLEEMIDRFESAADKNS